MATGTFWFLCGSMAVQLSGMLGGIFCARILGQAGFGSLNLLRSTILMFGVLAGSGFGVLAVKYVSEFRDANPQHAGRLLGLLIKVTVFTGTLATVLCLVLASPLASRAMKSTELVDAVRWGSLLLLLNTLNGVMMGIICGLEYFQIAFRINLLDALLSVTLIPFGAYLSGVTGAVCGTVAATALGLPLRYIYAQSGCRRMKITLSFIQNKKDLSEILRTILPTMVLGLAFQPFEWVARLLIARQPGGFAQLGLFAAANSFGAIASSIPTQLISTVQPLLGNLLGQREMRSFRRVALFSVLLSGAVSLIIALSLSVFSNQVMRSYGTQFLGAGGVLIISAFANVFFALATPCYKILIAYNRIWTQAVITLLLGLSLVISTMLLRHHGSRGIALAYLIAYAVMFFSQTGFIYNITRK
jgi:O-antigen/teichoic acid export membrane protein